MSMMHEVNLETGKAVDRELSPSEMAAHEADVLALENVHAARDLISEAQAALNKSDMTILRCSEKGAPVPAAWVTYRDDLRAIVKGGPGPIPARPAWPAGT